MPTTGASSEQTLLLIAPTGNPADVATQELTEPSYGRFAQETPEPERPLYVELTRFRHKPRTPPLDRNGEFNSLVRVDGIHNGPLTEQAEFSVSQSIHQLVRPNH